MVGKTCKRCERSLWGCNVILAVSGKEGKRRRVRGEGRGRGGGEEGRGRGGGRKK